MRRAGALAVTFMLCSTLAWGWGGETHRKMAEDALSSVSWLDSFGSLKPTSFDRMVSDVLGKAEAVGPGAFNFKDAATRQAKLDKYLKSTKKMTPEVLKQFAQHLLLSHQSSLECSQKERRKGISAKEILSTYSEEPDSGMDKGLDVSRHQKWMGGTSPRSTSSQGFRHMSFFFDKLGEAPQRAQLFFDLGAKAIKKGHPYWGFRFVAWGLHYLQDMGAPVHTNILPTLKYIRLKGMILKRNAQGKLRLNKSLLKDIATGSGQINANYHFLYERYVDKAYTQDGAAQGALSAAVQGDSSDPSPRATAKKFIKKLAKRRAWSRLSTPAIARSAIRFFGKRFRRPEPGGQANVVRSVNREIVENTVDSTSLKYREGKMATQRLQAGRQIDRHTQRQFQKTGVSIRQAMHHLGRRIGQVR